MFELIRRHPLAVLIAILLHLVLVLLYFIFQYQHQRFQDSKSSASASTLKPQQTPVISEKKLDKALLDKIKEIKKQPLKQVAKTEGLKRLDPEMEKLKAERKKQQEAARRFAKEKKKQEEAIRKEKERLAAEKKRQEKEAARLAEEKKKQEETQRKEQERLAAEKKRQEEEAARLAKEKKKQEETQRKEQERLAAERKRQEEEAARLAEEKKKQEDAQRKEQERLAAQQRAADVAAINRLLTTGPGQNNEGSGAGTTGQDQNSQSGSSKRYNDYVARIRTKIKRSWRLPPGTDASLVVEIRVNLEPGGIVDDVKILASSGNRLFDQTAEDAVYRADPLDFLPMGADFNQYKTLNLKFTPQAIR